MKPRSLHLTEDERNLARHILLPHLDALYRYACQLCGNAGDAEELAAESLRRGLENIRRLRDHSKSKQWLLRIINNTYLTHCRNRKRHKEIPYVEECDDGDGHSFSLFDQLATPFLLWWGNPEREVMNSLMDEDIREAVASLPAEYRSVVVLSDIEGYSYKEISEVLEVPIGTVRSRLARARSLLQRRLWHHALDAGIIKRPMKKDHHGDQKKVAAAD